MDQIPTPLQVSREEGVLVYSVTLSTFSVLAGIGGGIIAATELGSSPALSFKGSLLSGTFEFLVMSSLLTLATYLLLRSASTAYSRWQYHRTARPLFESWLAQEGKTSEACTVRDRTIDAYARGAKMVDLGQCLITFPPPQLWGLRQLTRLSLANNRLDQLSSQLGELQALTSLDLSSNQLTSLTPSIQKLTRLWKLNISNNKFKRFPEEVTSLSKLLFLDLSKNEFTLLPHRIGALTRLIFLSVEDNRGLTALPMALGNIRNLDALLWGNTRIPFEHFIAVDKALERRSRGDDLESYPEDVALWRRYEQEGRYDFLTQLAFFDVGEQLAFTELLRKLDNKISFPAAQREIVKLLEERSAQRFQPLKSARSGTPTP